MAWGGIQKKSVLEATPTPVELKRTLSICNEWVWMGRRNEGRLVEAFLVQNLNKKEND